MKKITINPGDVLSNCAMLFVFSPTAEDRSFQLQMEQLAEREATLQEHNVVVAEIIEGGSENAGTDSSTGEVEESLCVQFQVPKGRFRVMLIGKDTHVKLVADSCVSFEEVVMRVENEPHETEISSVMAS